MTTATAAIRIPGPPGPDLAPGWHPELPMCDYLALRAMSASGIEKFRRSPMHFEWSTRQPSTTTPALEKGAALHMALLEPDLFGSRIRRAGTCGKPLASGQRKGEPCGCSATVPDDTHGWLCGKHTDQDAPEGVLAPADYDDVIGMRDAVLAHPRARSILQGSGAAEITGVWEDPETGVLCKMRPDRLVDRAALMPDVKTTRDASKHAFKRQASNLGYFRKAQWYRRGAAALGLDLTSSAFIAVENVAPYGVAVYLLREIDLADADEEITRLLHYFAMCAAEDRWPGYGDEFQTLEMPAWDRHSTEDEDDE